MRLCAGKCCQAIVVLARLDSDTLGKYRVQQTRGSAYWVVVVEVGRRGVTRVIEAYIVVSAVL